MGAREMKVEGNRFFELLDGFGQKPRLAICAAKDDAQLRTVAELPEHALENSLRGSNLMLLEMSKAQGIGDVIITGRDSKRGLQLGCGLDEVPEHEIALAEHMVRARALRVSA